MRSLTFYVGRNSYAMYLKITPKYFPDSTIFVGVGLTHGRYDAVLAWPFPHRIRLEVCKGITMKMGLGKKNLKCPSKIKFYKGLWVMQLREAQKRKSLRTGSLSIEKKTRRIALRCRTESSSRLHTKDYRGTNSDKIF